MPPIRLAVWSGPRNISTALMRSWGNRPDTVVCDEPLYAHYLQRTAAPHPAAAEVVSAHEPDWRRVAAWLTGPVPDGKAVFYQKHMAHHLLPEVGREWIGSLTNTFLIREPREVITSFLKIVPEPTLADLGYPQQVELFEAERRRTGTTPVVVDARDVLDDPEGLLRAWCGRLGLPFYAEMLSWPPGPRPTDGVWAPHWYSAVLKTTGFEPYRPKNEPVPDRLRGLLAEAEPLYDRLHAHRLKA